MYPPNNFRGGPRGRPWEGGGVMMRPPGMIRPPGMTRPPMRPQVNAAGDFGRPPMMEPPEPVQPLLGAMDAYRRGGGLGPPGFAPPVEPPGMEFQPPQGADDLYMPTDRLKPPEQPQRPPLLLRRQSFIRP